MRSGGLTSREAGLPVSTAARRLWGSWGPRRLEPPSLSEQQARLPPLTRRGPRHAPAADTDTQRPRITAPVQRRQCEAAARRSFRHRPACPAPGCTPAPSGDGWSARRLGTRGRLATPHPTQHLHPPCHHTAHRDARAPPLRQLPGGLRRRH